MKHIKLLAIAFVSMLALASCNTDQEGPVYTPMSENIWRTCIVPWMWLSKDAA